VVTSELSLIANPASAAGDSKELVLDGDETCVKLLSLAVDGKELTEGIDYTLAPGKLTLLSPAAGSVIKTVVEIVPEENTQLSGLYKSGPMYCTQCEGTYH
jgi:aminopeptidase N